MYRLLRSQMFLTLYQGGRGGIVQCLKVFQSAHSRVSNSNSSKDAKGEMSEILVFFMFFFFIQY